MELSPTTDTELPDFDPVSDLRELSARDTASADAFQARWAAATAETPIDAGTPGVTAVFDAAGVLDRLDIDDDARAGIDGDTLGARISAALAAAPAVVPADPVAASAFADRALAALEGVDAGYEPETIADDFREFELVVVLGRPVGLRARPGWIDSQPSAVLSERIVALARRIAEGGASR